MKRSSCWSPKGSLPPRRGRDCGQFFDLIVLDNRLDWRNSKDVVYRKEQSRLYFPCHVCSATLGVFYESAVACTSFLWDMFAGVVTSKEGSCTEVVVEKRTRGKIGANFGKLLPSPVWVTVALGEAHSPDLQKGAVQAYKLLSDFIKVHKTPPVHGK